MKFTKNELHLMRYAVEDLLNGDDVPNEDSFYNKQKFETHVNEIINKIDNEINR